MVRREWKPFELEAWKKIIIEVLESGKFDIEWIEPGKYLVVDLRKHRWKYCYIELEAGYFKEGQTIITFYFDDLGISIWDLLFWDKARKTARNLGLHILKIKNETDKGINKVYLKAKVKEKTKIIIFSSSRKEEQTLSLIVKKAKKIEIIKFPGGGYIKGEFLRETTETTKVKDRSSGDRGG